MLSALFGSFESFLFYKGKGVDQYKIYQHPKYGKVDILAFAITRNKLNFCSQLLESNFRWQTNHEAHGIDYHKFVQNFMPDSQELLEVFKPQSQVQLKL